MAYSILGVTSFSANSAVKLEALVEVSEREQNLATNTTYEDILFHAYCTNGVTWRAGAAGNVSMWFNGVQLYNGPWDYDFRSSVSRTLADEIRTIVHNADGTKTVGWSIAITDPQIGNASLSGSYALPTIPRATTPTLAYATRDAGQTQTVSLPRASGSFTHKVEYRFAGGAWTEIASAAGASFGPWTIPESILTAIPDGSSGTLTFRVTTFSGSTQIGDPKTVNMTVTVPATGLPDFTISSIEETVAALATLMGASTGPFIQGKSVVKANLSAPTPYQGSTIDQIQVSIDGVSVTDGTDWASGARAIAFASVLPTAGSRTVSVTVWDKRGKTRTKTAAVTVHGYSLPSASGVQINRTNNAGSLSDTGTYLTILAAKSAVSLPNAASAERNALYYRVDYKLRTASVWTLGAVVTPGGRTHSAPIGPTNGFAAANGYDVRLVLMDNTVPAASRANATTGVSIFGGFLSTQVVPVDFHPNGVGLGKRWERGAADADERMYQRNGQTILDDGDFSSNAQAVAKASGAVALTPANLPSLNATETMSGLAERISTAEAEGLADDVRYLTVLKMVQALAKVTVPMCKLTKSSAQSTSGTALTQTAITWNTEAHDNDNMHSTVSNTSRITITRPGFYWIRGSARFNNTTTRCGLQLAINGSTVQTAIDAYEVNPNNAFPKDACVIYLSTGDYLELMMSSASASVALIVANCSFEAMWMGA